MKILPLESSYGQYVSIGDVISDLNVMIQEAPLPNEYRMQLANIVFDLKRKLMIRKIWTLWAKSLGDKSSKLDREADMVAVMRTLIVLINIITCMFIVANVIKHW